MDAQCTSAVCGVRRSGACRLSMALYCNDRRKEGRHQWQHKLQTVSEALAACSGLIYLSPNTRYNVMTCVCCLSCIGPGDESIRNM